MIRVLSVCALALLAGCAAAPVSEQPTRAPATSELPPMKTFGSYQPAPIRATNRQLAADFMELSFQMESGRQLTRFTRFEGPVRVAVRGAAPSTLGPDLARLLERLRREAGIDIARAGQGAEAQIVVEALTRKQIQRYVPQAACFVVPNVDGFDEFVRNRRSTRVDWTRLETRTKASVFVPSDVSPQEIRDCLHEEIAQALGPLNDLYRLENSVFNDDNFHPVLTSFDMLMLRVTYAPQLRSGMSPAQVQQALPGILDRVNPAGRGAGSAAPIISRRDWISAVESALGPGTSPRRREETAVEAVRIARDAKFTDVRHAFSYYVLGRLALGSDPELSLASFLQAGGLYSEAPGTEVQQAHVTMQIVAFALTNGQPDTALRLVNEALPAVQRSENAALLATLMMMKAEALDMLGRPNEARTVRLDSLGWARYGIGSDDQVRARLAEISSLPPPLWDAERGS
ncbi:conserved hypothetical protein [Dinoroseobacter shibae DFL 12 = DSM 16493]|jgi:hypothetical protein|uniref:ATP-dependent transcriptional regulator n=1 Tax=Dinoroseobacter shibae (strain DSM 16493 / NCIMB 14021 / DFL 12) TaxID=398580 RepID=A8LNB0_DINSH|nr:DUF2927 domain-containing protein [Dinoroseobacter shibae]ABV93623.1 conserved hypothetical protein [Dinoroseobacter shibae DFL 12 = DSM 16493]URF45075.1 DUF2927 domain-containing protein [Dinoroseobacter shibae]URF49379.1 DUF2927 domain-containing protein [Dinoroseobacter shibae]